MIPVIDVRRSAAEKRYEGTLAFAFRPDDALNDLPYTSFAGDAKAELCYRIAEDRTVTVDGTVEFTLEGECSRCLSPAVQTVEGAVYGVFTEGDGDGETYGYRGGTVRLEELMRDTVVFALPHLLLCKACADEI